MRAPVSSPPVANPYVGPRPFDRGERLYGRDLEVAELRDLLIAERIVLLYSPSGAGKTSLIRASLLPELQAEGFRVLPEVRVAAELPRSGDTVPALNRYLASTLLCLENSEERRPGLDDLAGKGLNAYLQERYGEDDDIVLIFDQFEELLVTDLADPDSKVAFLRELGAALRNRRRWALFAMREDYVAGLDPYLRLLPTQLRITFRLDLLGQAAARAAIQSPASEKGVDFSDDAAQRLVDNLRRVRVRRPEGTEDVPGQYVEPVHLQVVCQRLWERPRPDPGRITAEDVEDVGDVDSVLAGYYAEQIGEVLAETGADERALRDWFDRVLITEEGMRTQTRSGPLHGGAGDERVLERLDDARLIRKDTRGGVTWVELAHDRLVDPVRKSNAAWREANLEPFQRQAQLWHSESRPDHLLLTGEGLAEADRWAAEHSARLEPLERDFLAASREGEKRRGARRLARLASSAALVFALVVTVVAAYGILLSLSNARASEAQLLLDVDPAMALAKALQATQWPSTPAARAALTQSFAEFRLRAVLRDPERSADTLDVSLDGRLVVTTSTDGTAQLWEVATGEEIAEFGEQVRGAEFSPDGSRIVTASLDGTARVWDTHGHEQAVLQGHEEAVTSARWSPDGMRIVSASRDGTARVWDTRGQRLAELQDSEERVSSAEWSPDGSSIVSIVTIVTASASEPTRQIIRVWDPSTGLTSSESIVPVSRIIPQAAVFSPDGSRILTAVEDTTYLYDARLGPGQIELPGAKPVFSTDGQYVLTVDDRAVKVWSLREGDGMSVLQGFREPVSELQVEEVFTARFDADGGRVVTGSRDGVTRVWDVATRVPLLELRGHRGRVTAAVFARSRPEVVVTAGDDGTARVWDAAVGSLFTGYDEWLNSASFDADGRLVVGAGADGVARVWPSEGGGPQKELPTDRPLNAAEFAPDGVHVVTGEAAGMVRVWDWKAARVVASVPVGQEAVNAVGFDRSGRFVVIAGSDAIVRVWEWQTERLRLLPGHEDSVTDAAFSPDGRRIVSASRDGTARVWNAVSAELVQTLKSRTGVVSSAAFDPTGERVVTAGEDTTARIWEVATGRMVAVLSGHEKALTDAAFSADGRYVVTGASDGTIGLWEARSGQKLALLALHSGTVLSLHFSPTGPLILTASIDGTSRVYDCEICAPLPELRALAEQRLRDLNDQPPAQL